MISKHTRSLPVVMHHLVNEYPGLSVTAELFEENCKYMAEQGWRGVSLEEAEDFLLKKKKLPPKSFLFTFDDGYLDNYVNAWPILEKYGHKGVVFAVADYIDESERASGALRPTLADVWAGKTKLEELPDVNHPVRENALGYATRRDAFFNWAEARAMEQSGVLAIAGHSLRHEAVYTGPDYTGFRKPGPETIAFNRTVRDDFWGCPLFSRGPELANRAFIPEPGLIQAIKKLVPQDEPGADLFFKDESNITALEKLVSAYAGRLGRFESDKEQEQRIGRIMRSNQDILQKELGHGVKSFCWPWGVKNEVAIKAGLEAGFEVFYNVSRGPNPAGNHMQVNRFKAKRSPGKWLLSRAKIYSHPLLGKLYSKARI